MTYPLTNTLTRTTSITMTDVRHVLWRIASDLRVLRAQHAMLTAEREEQIREDLIAFIYRNFVDQIEFRFVHPATNTACYRVRYALTRSWSGDDDDGSGGLRFRDLRGTTFSVIISYTRLWINLSENDKIVFRKTLKRSWDRAEDVADGSGYWTTDRNYGSGGLGASRSVFRAV